MNAVHDAKQIKWEWTGHVMRAKAQSAQKKKKRNNA